MPFAVSHDLTHLGRKVREHIPLKKNHNMPWTHGPANITAFLIDFASRFPPGALGTWILETYFGIYFASRFPPMTRLVRKVPVHGISH